MTPQQSIQRLRSYRGQVASRDLAAKKLMAIEMGMKPRASYKVVLDAIDRQITAAQTPFN